MAKTKKYLVKKGEVGTSNGFWYDLTGGGYMNPHEILVDQERASRLKEAVDLLYAWEQELKEDGIIREW